MLFLKPKQSGSEWEDTELRRSVAAIPSVMVLSDVDGAEARRFGAETSGHTLLFDRDGRLLFSGGITVYLDHFLRGIYWPYSVSGETNRF